MKRTILILTLTALIAMPCVLHAEEEEILLSEVIGMSVLPGDNPLDDPEQSVPTPPRPRSFRATIDGSTLSISKQDEAIPSAQAIVVNASTGSIVVNEQFTTTMSEQIYTSGTYVLRIETAGGALVGQFVVQ